MESVLTCILTNGEQVVAEDLMTITEAAGLEFINKSRQAVQLWVQDRDHPLRTVYFHDTRYTTEQWCRDYIAKRDAKLSKTPSATEKRQARKIWRLERDMAKLQAMLDGKVAELKDEKSGD